MGDDLRAAIERLANSNVQTSAPRLRRGDLRKGTRQVYFPQTGFAPCAVYDRYSFAAGIQLSGPAVIEERESTIVAGPDARITVDKHLNVVMEID